VIHYVPLYFGTFTAHTADDALMLALEFVNLRDNNGGSSFEFGQFLQETGKPEVLRPGDELVITG
jgi:hypothetical protein